MSFVPKYERGLRTELCERTEHVFLNSSNTSRQVRITDGPPTHSRRALSQFHRFQMCRTILLNYVFKIHFEAFKLEKGSLGCSHVSRVDIKKNLARDQQSHKYKQH